MINMLVEQASRIHARWKNFFGNSVLGKPGGTAFTAGKGMDCRVELLDKAIEIPNGHQGWWFGKVSAEPGLRLSRSTALGTDARCLLCARN